MTQQPKDGKSMMDKLRDVNKKVKNKKMIEPEIPEDFKNRVPSDEEFSGRGNIVESGFHNND